MQSKLTHQISTPLGDERSHGYTLYLHPQSEHKTKGSQDIHQILRDGYHHRHARILHPDKPTVESEES